MDENEIKDDDAPEKANENEPLFKQTENDVSSVTNVEWDEDRFVWDLSEL